MLRWPRAKRRFNVAERQFGGVPFHTARVRVESRSKDGNFHRVETAYAAGMDWSSQVLLHDAR